MPGRAPDSGPAWDERAQLSPLAAVLDPSGTEQKNQLLSLIQLRRLLSAIGGVSGLKVLDFGTGTGRLADALARRGAWVLGIDSSAPMAAAAAREVPLARFVVAEDGRCLQPRSVDLVTSVMVLQYFAVGPDLDGALRTLAELLKPAARLVILEQVRDAGLERGATLRQYVSAVEATGLRVVAVKPVRLSDSKALAAALKFPFLSRWLHVMSATEARLSRRPLSNGRYAEFVIVAEAS